MHSIVSRLRLFAFFVLLTALYFACTKITTTDIGSGLIPPVDGVITKDTVLDILAKNKSFDTVTVGFSDDHVLGYINDPIFGTTTASVNFQVAPPTTPITFGAPKSNLIFDSVVLSLHYTGVWGDSASHLFLHVYEMDAENKFNVDSPYNNTISFEKGRELTEGSVAKDISILNISNVDTFKTYNEAVTNQMRVRLDPSFGERLLDYDTAVVYASAATFNNYFKGFIVEPEQQTSSKALIKINLTDTSTRLSLYYHFTNGAGIKDSAVRRFAPSALSSASSNTITRNYTGTTLQQYFSSTATQDDLIYIQTSPGTYAMLKTPGLGKLQNMIVHRAEILMQQVPDAGDTYLTSPRLFLSAYSADSLKRFAIPYDITFSGGTISNLSEFGVVPITKKDAISGSSISTYSFDITRYVQGIVTRKDSVYDLALWAPYNSYIAEFADQPANTFTFPISSPVLNTAAIGRVRLGGGNNAQYKMRLHIVYSKP